MTSNNSKEEVSGSTIWLRRLSLISAWLLLAAVLVLVVSGWGITHTEIIYKATFGLIDRGLANSIHRVANVPMAFFFLSHVLMNIRLGFSRISRPGSWLLDGVLMLIGLASMAAVWYMESLV